MKLGTLVKLRSPLTSSYLRSCFDPNIVSSLFYANQIGILAQKKDIKLNSTLDLVDFFILTSSGNAGWIYARDVREC